ncbi:MAG: MerR family transcriptional regulator [Candidatus Omnitrophica bacterium]|nr:MerR family transcriptional regulator [Candidatus Omnitrophota bacterium]
MNPKKPMPKEVEINPDQALFVIGIVSELTGMPVWTLRRLDDMGVVSPKRINKKIRCYTHRQVNKLIYIHYLMEERSVNISGIKVILELEEK